MSAFNGEKFYGYSPVREPYSLSAIPRNFEFKFIRPEQLDKAIKQAQQDKTLGVTPALKAHTTRARNSIRDEEFDVKEYNLRDSDVETVMSHNRMQKTRILSEQEVDEIVQQANMNESCQSITQPVRVSKFPKVDIAKLLENMPSTKPFSVVLSEHTSKTFVQAKNSTNDDQDLISLAKAVESSLQAVESLLQKREKESKSREFFESTSLDFYTPKPKHVVIEEKPITESLLVSEIKEPFLYKNPLGDRVTTQLSAIQSVESMRSSSPKEELESESEIDYKSWEEVKSSNGQESDMSTSDVKVAKSSMSFFKSISPMTLTTDDAESEQNMRVVITNKKIFNETLPLANVQKPITEAPKADIPMQSVKQWQPSNARTSRSKYQQMSTYSLGSVAYSARAPMPKNDAKLTARTQSLCSTNSARTAPTKPLSRLLSGRNRSDKNIETIKTQKQELFQKMGQTHERMIELLDKIKMALLETHLPTSIQEKNKRQKNAMEFSVRFSRNFLYPLKGMIDDLRLTGPEALNSVYSNDATLRVNAIFNLLQQALATYHKQLRYFLLNQVPQKLNCVLEMIITITKCCLTKGFFDKNDTIVKCLLDRCSNFLDFLSDLHYKPEKHALTNVRVTNPSRMPNKNYELKMCMNGLNMYEPKLVPKRRFRKTVPKTKDVDSPIVVQTQMLSSARKSQELFKLNYENEPTQMMSVQQSEIESESPKKSNSQGMAMKLSAALKSATKQQVAQVIVPLLAKIGVSPDPQNTENFRTAETIINTFTEEILNIVEKTNPTPILKSKKQRKVVTGNTAKGLSKKAAAINSTHKATSKALKARKRTNVLRRHKTNKTIKSAKSTAAAISEQAPHDDDTKHINNDDTQRQHMFDGNNNSNHIKQLFKLILNKTEEIVHRKEEDEDEESSEYESDSDADNDDDDDNGETGDDNDEYSGNDDSSSETEEETPICSKEFAPNPNVQCDLEAVSEEEQVNCIEATAGNVEQVLNTMNVDSLKPSTSSLETVLVEKNLPISSQKKSNEKRKVRKTRLYGKKKARDPMGSPPPAPVASPSNSVSSLDRLELMRRQLEYANSKQNPHDEAVTPTHVSMSPINNPKVATLPQMTSDAKAKVVMTLENIEVPLTEAYLDNENKSMKNVIKNFPPKNGDISPKYTPNQETNETNVQAPNYQISSKTNSRVLRTHESPYDMRAWENAMKDLPQVHKDETLKTIMEQERTLYEAFKEQEAGDHCKNDDPDNISSLFKERNKFLEDCTKNRFYTNPAYEQPWKIFSNIANVITQDIVEDVENDFTQGVSRFVQDFVQLETQL